MCNINATCDLTDRPDNDNSIRLCDTAYYTHFNSHRRKNLFCRLLELESRLEQERKTVAQQSEELAFLEQQVLCNNIIEGCIDKLSICMQAVVFPFFLQGSIHSTPFPQCEEIFKSDVTLHKTIFDNIVNHHRAAWNPRDFKRNVLLHVSELF